MENWSKTKELIWSLGSAAAIIALMVVVLTALSLIV